MVNNGNGFEHKKNTSLKEEKQSFFIKGKEMLFKYEKYTSILFLVILSGVCVSLALNQSVWLDESLSMRWSDLSWYGMFCVLAVDVHPPLHYVMLKIVNTISGNSLLVAKLFCVAGFSMMLVAGYIFFRKHVNRGSIYFYSAFLISLPFMLVKTVEVRMYSWSMAFAVFSGVAMYYVLAKPNKKHWCLFVLAGLASAYNHYYGVIMEVFVYGAVVIYFFIQKDWKNIKNWLWCCVATVIGYLPWLFIALKQISTVNQNYWITNDSSIVGYLKELLRVDAFPHSTKVYCLVIGIFTIILAYKYWKERNPLDFVGVACTLPFWGTLIFGMLYSNLVKPVLISRYLIFSFCLLVFGISIACKYIYKTVIAAMCVFFLTMMVLTYPSVYEAEFDTATDKTLEFFEENVKETDRIVYNHGALGSVLLFYLPNTEIDNTETFDIYQDEYEYDTVWFLDSIEEVGENREMFEANGNIIDSYSGYGIDNVYFTIYKLEQD